MEIKLATQQDIEEVGVLYQAIRKHLEENVNYTAWGNTQWGLNDYPTVNVAQEAFNNNHLYIAKNDSGEIIGTVVLNSNQDKTYLPVEWQHDKFLVVHTLATSPNHLKQGVARAILAFAEKLATENGLNSIRLDTFELNTPAQKLYESLGYNYRGIIDLKPNIDRKEKYFVYEKLLEEKK